jgi:hypothetical protein
MLEGSVITPRWLFSASLPEMHNKQGEILGVGAYVLPPHLQQIQLAEISAWLDLQGQKNNLFQRFLFQANQGQEILQEAGWVHRQPHAGNVIVSLIDNFLPIIKDFSTLTDISAYPREKIIRGQDLSPFSANLIQDFSILNYHALMVSNYLQHVLTEHPYLSLGLLPEGFTMPALNINSLIDNLAWVAAGRVAPKGTMPTPQSLEAIKEIVARPVERLAKHYAGGPDGLEGHLNEIVQGFGLAMINGKYPVDSVDRDLTKFNEQLQSAYVPSSGKRRH